MPQPGQLDVFPSTFMPGHGPSRRNHQDQDQDQDQRKTLPVFVHINGYLKSVSQPRQPTQSQRRAFTRFHPPFNNSKKLHSGVFARLAPTEEVCMVVKKVMVTAADI